MQRFTAAAALIVAACGSTPSSKGTAPPQSITVAPATAPTITATEPANPAPAAGAKAFVNRMLVKHAKVDTLALHPVAEKWRVDHGGNECPTVERLKLDKEISASSKLEDPWGHRYEVRCADDDTFVVSAGPDGRFGTPDDIATPDSN